jgi:hypothetical protein
VRVREERREEKRKKLIEEGNARNGAEGIEKREEKGVNGKQKRRGRGRRRNKRRQVLLRQIPLFDPGSLKAKNDE